MTLEALKNNRKVVGTKQTIKAIEKQKVKIVFIAMDAEEKIITPLEILCKEKNIPLEKVETMHALGKACGIEVGTASACLLD